MQICTYTKDEINEQIMKCIIVLYTNVLFLFDFIIN